MAKPPTTDPGAPPRGRSVWRALGRLAVGLLVMAGLAGLGAGGGWLALTRAFSAPGPLTADRTVEIPAGSGLAAIADHLAAEGVIASPLVFRLGVLASGQGRRLKAGEYRFAPGTSGRAVAAALAAGRVVVRRLTVPEGLTSAAIVDLVMAADGLVGPPGPLPPEGSLLPETYHYHRGDRRDRLLARMQTAQADLLARLWPDRAPDLPLATPADAVRLASIVEKETGRPDERPIIAGVFVNRLRRGMRLQSDPTVVYGLSAGTGVLGRALTRTDLATAHPWNTYVIAGLPPSPICNPGAEALRAVLHPAATTALYFVADGAGGHRFADTLDDHNRNVRAWRAGQAADSGSP